MEKIINDSIHFFDDFQKIYTLSELKYRLCIMLSLDSCGEIETCVRHRLYKCAGKAELRKFLFGFKKFLYGRNK